MSRRTVHLDHGNQLFEGTIDDGTEGRVVRIGDAEYVVRDAGCGELIVIDDDGCRHRFLTAVDDEGSVHVGGGGGAWTFSRHVPGVEAGAVSEGDGDLRAPMVGRVVSVAVEAGASVDADAVCVVVEAMKMEYSLRAPFAATVSAVSCAPGDQVDMGQSLVKLEPIEDIA